MCLSGKARAWIPDSYRTALWFECMAFSRFKSSDIPCQSCPASRHVASSRMQMSRTLACGLGHLSLPPRSPGRPSRCCIRQVCSLPYALASVGFLLASFNSPPGEIQWAEGAHTGLWLHQSPLGICLLGPGRLVWNSGARAALKPQPWQVVQGSKAAREMVSFSQLSGACKLGASF